MKRILATAIALTMTVAVGSAQAHHGGNGSSDFGHHFGRHHHHHHGFAIAGTNASFNGTKNADGTYTGDLTLTLKQHSDKFARARKSNGTGDQPATKTFHLDNAQVKFDDSITDANGDGTVDFSDVQPTDVVVLKVFGGHHGDHSSKAHSSCDNGQNNASHDNSSDTTPTITKAFVFRPSQG
ncbi:MAG TPA: hypothetical protein VGI67_20215 [Thermoleophilaceae bacterium]|jgi:hypothetical protein